MGDEGIPHLHLAALLSWYYWCPEARAASEKTEVEREERIKNFRSTLARVFGNKYDFRITINGGCLETEIEGLRLTAYEFAPTLKTENTMMVALLGRCPSCGVETMSSPFITLAGLGRILENFEPISRHTCGP